MRMAVILLLALGACSKGGEEQASQPPGNAATPAPAPAPTEAQPVAYASLTGDPAHGERVFIQCKACHTVEPGQNRLGPTLHGIVGRPAASIPGYVYSPSMKASGLTFTEEELYAYLEAPQKTVPGTKMAFAGVKKPQDRADLIAWLKTQAN